MVRPITVHYNHTWLSQTILTVNISLLQHLCIGKKTLTPNLHPASPCSPGIHHQRRQPHSGFATAVFVDNLLLTVFGLGDPHDNMAGIAAYDSWYAAQRVL
jgi:hypothetical protein